MSSPYLELGTGLKSVTISVRSVSLDRPTEDQPWDWEFDRSMILHLENCLLLKKINSVLVGIGQQTRDKNMYDAREKYRRDQQWILNVSTEEAEARGMAIAEAQGKAIWELVGKIKILQEILGIPISDDNELSKMSHDELQSICATLQAQVKGLS